MQVSTAMETETGGMIVKRVSVPIGLEELMEGLTKEVVLKKPKDIYLFASEYFTRLLMLREKGSYKAKPIRRVQSVTRHTKQQLQEKEAKVLSKQTSVRENSPVKKINSPRKPITPRKPHKEDDGQKESVQGRYRSRKYGPRDRSREEKATLQATASAETDNKVASVKRDRSLSSTRRGRSIEDKRSTKISRNPPIGTKNATDTNKKSPRDISKDKEEKSDLKKDFKNKTGNVVKSQGDTQAVITKILKSTTPSLKKTGVTESLIAEDNILVTDTRKIDNSNIETLIEENNEKVTHDSITKEIVEKGLQGDLSTVPGEKSKDKNDKTESDVVTNIDSEKKENTSTNLSHGGQELKVNPDMTKAEEQKVNLVEHHKLNETEESEKENTHFEKEKSEQVQEKLEETEVYTDENKKLVTVDGSKETDKVVNSKDVKNLEKPQNADKANESKNSENDEHEIKINENVNKVTEPVEREVIHSKEEKTEQILKENTKESKNLVEDDKLDKLKENENFVNSKEIKNLGEAENTNETNESKSSEKDEHEVKINENGNEVKKQAEKEVAHSKEEKTEQILEVEGDKLKENGNLVNNKVIKNLDVENTNKSHESKSSEKHEVEIKIDENVHGVKEQVEKEEKTEQILEEDKNLVEADKIDDLKGNENFVNSNEIKNLDEGKSTDKLETVSVENANKNEDKEQNDNLDLFKTIEEVDKLKGNEQSEIMHPNEETTKQNLDKLKESDDNETIKCLEEAIHSNKINETVDVKNNENELKVNQNLNEVKVQDNENKKIHLKEETTEQILGKLKAVTNNNSEETEIKDKGNKMKDVGSERKIENVHGELEETEINKEENRVPEKTVLIKETENGLESKSSQETDDKTADEKTDVSLENLVSKEIENKNSKEETHTDNINENKSVDNNKHELKVNQILNKSKVQIDNENVTENAVKTDTIKNKNLEEKENTHKVNKMEDKARDEKIKNIPELPGIEVNKNDNIISKETVVLKETENGHESNITKDAEDKTEDGNTDNNIDTLKDTKVSKIENENSEEAETIVKMVDKLNDDGNICTEEANKNLKEETTKVTDKFDLKPTEVKELSSEKEESGEVALNNEEDTEGNVEKYNKIPGNIKINTDKIQKPTENSDGLKENAKIQMKDTENMDFKEKNVEKDIAIENGNLKKEHSAKETEHKEKGDENKNAGKHSTNLLKDEHTIQNKDNNMILVKENEVKNKILAETKEEKMKEESKLALTENVMKGDESKSANLEKLGKIEVSEDIQDKLTSIESENTVKLKEVEKDDNKNSKKEENKIDHKNSEKTVVEFANLNKKAEFEQKKNENNSLEMKSNVKTSEIMKKPEVDEIDNKNKSNLKEAENKNLEGAELINQSEGKHIEEHSNELAKDLEVNETITADENSRKVAVNNKNDAKQLISEENKIEEENSKSINSKEKEEKDDTKGKDKNDIQVEQEQKEETILQDNQLTAKTTESEEKVFENEPVVLDHILKKNINNFLEGEKTNVFIQNKSEIDEKSLGGNILLEEKLENTANEINDKNKTSKENLKSEVTTKFPGNKSHLKNKQKLANTKSRSLSQDHIKPDSSKELANKNERKIRRIKSVDNKTLKSRIPTAEKIRQKNVDPSDKKITNKDKLNEKTTKTEHDGRNKKEKTYTKLDNTSNNNLEKSNKGNEDKSEDDKVDESKTSPRNENEMQISTNVENSKKRNKRSTSVDELTTRSKDASKDLKKNKPQSSFDVNTLRKELKTVEAESKLTTFKSSYNPYILRDEIKKASSNQSKNDSSNIFTEAAAALKIQSIWRGFKVRKNKTPNVSNLIDKSKTLADKNEDKIFKTDNVAVDGQKQLDQLNGEVKNTENLESNEDDATDINIVKSSLITQNNVEDNELKKEVQEIKIIKNKQEVINSNEKKTYTNKDINEKPNEELVVTSQTDEGVESNDTVGKQNSLEINESKHPELENDDKIEIKQTNNKETIINTKIVLNKSEEISDVKSKMKTDEKKIVTITDQQNQPKINEIIVKSENLNNNEDSNKTKQTSNKEESEDTNKKINESDIEHNQNIDKEKDNKTEDQITNKSNKQLEEEKFENKEKTENHQENNITENLTVKNDAVDEDHKKNKTKVEKSEEKSTEVGDNIKPEKFANAALKIQKIWRGFQIRKIKQQGEMFGDTVTAKKPDTEIIDIQSKERKRSTSALKIQSLWRGYQVRKDIRNVRDVMDKLQESNTQENVSKEKVLTDDDILNAATKIQAGVRGYLQRKKNKKNNFLKAINEETSQQESDTTPTNVKDATNLKEEDILKAITELDKIEIPSDIPHSTRNKRETPQLLRSVTVQEPEIVKENASLLIKTGSLDQTAENLKLHQQTEEGDLKDDNNNENYNKKLLTPLENEVKNAIKNITSSVTPSKFNIASLRKEIHGNINDSALINSGETSVDNSNLKITQQDTNIVEPTKINQDFDKEKQNIQNDTKTLQSTNDETSQDSIINTVDLDSKSNISDTSNNLNAMIPIQEIRKNDPDSVNDVYENAPTRPVTSDVVPNTTSNENNQIVANTESLQTDHNIIRAENTNETNGNVVKLKEFAKNNSKENSDDTVNILNKINKIMDNDSKEESPDNKKGELTQNQNSFDLHQLRKDIEETNKILNKQLVNDAQGTDNVTNEDSEMESKKNITNEDSEMKFNKFDIHHLRKQIKESNEDKSEQSKSPDKESDNKVDNHDSVSVDSADSVTTVILNQEFEKHYDSDGKSTPEAKENLQKNEMEEKITIPVSEIYENQYENSADSVEILNEDLKTSGTQEKKNNLKESGSVTQGKKNNLKENDSETQPKKNDLKENDSATQKKKSDLKENSSNTQDKEIYLKENDSDTQEKKNDVEENDLAKNPVKFDIAQLKQEIDEASSFKDKANNLHELDQSSLHTNINPEINKTVPDVDSSLVLNNIPKVLERGPENLIVSDNNEKIQSEDERISHNLNSESEAKQFNNLPLKTEIEGSVADLEQNVTNKIKEVGVLDEKSADDTSGLVEHKDLKEKDSTEVNINESQDGNFHSSQINKEIEDSVAELKQNASNKIKADGTSADGKSAVNTSGLVVQKKIEEENFDKSQLKKEIEDVVKQSENYVNKQLDGSKIDTGTTNNKELEENLAATKIQSTFRGYRVRRDIKSRLPSYSVRQSPPRKLSDIKEEQSELKSSTESNPDDSSSFKNGNYTDEDQKVFVVDEVPKSEIGKNGRDSAEDYKNGNEVAPENIRKEEKLDNLTKDDHENKPKISKKNAAKQVKFEDDSKEENSNKTENLETNKLNIEQPEVKDKITLQVEEQSSAVASPPQPSVRLLHTGEFHDTIVIPLTPPVQISTPESSLDSHNEGKPDNNTSPASASPQMQTVVNTVQGSASIPLAVQLNQAPPAGTEIVTSPRSFSSVSDVEKIAQASDKDALPPQSRTDIGSPPDSSMETEKRNNATLNSKNMEVQAATKIQAGFRGYQVRKQLKLKSNPPENTNQRRSARRKSSGKLTEIAAKTKPKDKSDLEETEKEKSAVKIQAGIRGFLVRRRQKKQNKKLES